MATHIYERAGVLLSIDYLPGEEPTFNSVRVLDADYRPTGPELRDLFHELFVLTGPSDGSHLLSLVAEDLPCLPRNPSPALL